MNVARKSASIFDGSNVRFTLSRGGHTGCRSDVLWCCTRQISQTRMTICPSSAICSPATRCLWKTLQAAEIRIGCGSKCSCPAVDSPPPGLGCFVKRATLSLGQEKLLLVHLILRPHSQNNTKSAFGRANHSPTRAFVPTNLASCPPGRSPRAGRVAFFARQARDSVRSLQR